MTPEETYHSIAEATEGVTKGKMFGAHCLKTPNGKAACMYYKGNMVFKLSGDAERDAMSLDGAQTFEPAAGKKMNGWTQVPFEYADRWKEFAQASVDYVKAL